MPFTMIGEGQKLVQGVPLWHLEVQKVLNLWHEHFFP